MTPLHQFHGHLRIQNLIMQMIFHLEMNWWTDIGTAHTNFGNNQNASHGEAHRHPNQIALKSPMVVQPSRCLLVPPLSSCRYPLSLVKQRSIHPDLDWLVTSAGEHTFLLLGRIPFFLGLDSHSIYCGFACSD